MTIIEEGEKTSFKLKQGEPTTLNFNRPCRFELETTSGTVIKGTITPNNPLTINPQSDIKKFEITIEKESLHKPSKVDK